MDTSLIKGTETLDLVCKIVSGILIRLNLIRGFHVKFFITRLFVYSPFWGVIDDVLYI